MISSYREPIILLIFKPAIMVLVISIGRLRAVYREFLYNLGPWGPRGPVESGPPSPLKKIKVV